MIVRSLIDRSLDLLFPPACALCGLGIPAGRVCRGCVDDLPRIERPCPACAMPLPGDGPEDLECAACQRHPQPLRRTIAPFHYRYPVDSLIKGLKFRHRLWIAPALAELLAPALVHAGLDVDALVPVPLHRWRHALRGFNQADELARALGPRSGIPVSHCLRRTRATRPQSGLDSRARRRNVADSFKVARGCRIGHAMLVDDVVTTGATAAAAAKALLRAGVSEVSLIAVARAT